jgi:ankyrin repeat protein
VHIKRVHLWWIVPLALISAFTTAGWWFVDTLHYGNASSLHRAVMQDDCKRVKRLIARGADVNTRMKAGLFPDTWGATPLHLAARQDGVELVEELIRAGADKDAADELGFTPLHAALRDGADAAAQVLIRASARVRSDTNDGRSGYALENCGQPLRTALQRASIATVRLLLVAGADPRSDIGDDALAYADGPDRVAKLQLLLEGGFSVEGSSTMGRPLHVAAENNDAAAIALLLDRGADIEAKSGSYEFTPLLAAAYAGSNDAVRMLLERGANPKAGTEHFGSPVYAAAFSGKRETVRLLLSMNLGIDLQAGRASDQATPLHFAYWNNDSEMASLLIKAGALSNARTTDGRLPAEYRK